MDKTLVVMAAGLGSRYGSVKQIERVGPEDEILMEYAIYDAVAAGFNRLVIIIKPDMLEDCIELFGERIERSTGIKIDYALQLSERFTEAYPQWRDRKKPFGTVHAVLCAREFIKTPFAVVNADDYYGRDTFTAISAELEMLSTPHDAAMVAFRLKNTVSPHGTVTRGVCSAENGFLTKVTETYKIRLMPDGRICDTSGDTESELDSDSLVSMNIWGYHPDVLGELLRYFDSFLAALPSDNTTAECLLPTMMDDLIGSGHIRTSVLSTRDQWFGLTYKEDKPVVVESLRKLHAAGIYPASLWNN